MIKDFLTALGNYKKFGKLAKNSGWRVAGYLAIFLIICSIGAAVIPTIKIANAFGTFFKEELPEFTISNEGLEIAEDFGFELAGIKALVTTSREVSEQEFGDNVSGVLIDANSVIIRNMGETAEFSFSEFNPENEVFSFSKSDLDLLAPFMSVFKASLAIAMAISFIASYLFNGLFIGLVSIVMGAILKVRKPLGEHIKIGLYSKTLPTVASAVLNPFGFFLPPLIGTIYALVVIFLYLKSERDTDVPPELV